MKICFVGSLPKPYGGVASHSYHLTKELAGLGVKVDFVDTRLAKEKMVPPGVRHLLIADLGLYSTLRQISKLPRLAGSWIPIIRYWKCLRPRDFVKVVYIILKILDSFRPESVDLFHAQHANERALATWVVAKRFKKPLVITAHCGEFTEDFFWSRCSRLVKHMTTAAARVISVSKYTQKCMIVRGCKGHVSIIPNGVDTHFFRPGLEVSELRRKYRLEKPTRVALFVGDIHRRKGPDVFLKAVPFVLEKNFKAIIVGSKGGQQESLRQLIRELSISDRVLMIEEVEHELLPQFYNLADIFVFPTVMKTEGFGIVALESMACGTPVIASRIGGIPEVVREDQTGFLFEPGNFQELSEKINVLLADDAMRANLGRAGRELVESEYTWTVVAQKTLDIYRAAIENYRFGR